MAKTSQDANVRILQINGTVSKEVYIIDEAADRKGLVGLKQKGSLKTIKVIRSRILPTSADGKAVVIESGDKYKVVCPECDSIGAITDTDTWAGTCEECKGCEKEFSLHWLGVKPMAEAITTNQEGSNMTTKTNRTVAVEPVRVDLKDLQKYGELYTKKGVRFDHHEIDVQSHVLLFVGENPRKLCFNTYDGCLGKKNKGLPLEDFKNNEQQSGKRLWFDVKDVAKQQEALRKKGYSRADDPSDDPAICAANRTDDTPVACATEACATEACATEACATETCTDDAREASVELNEG
jgi:hypothetical protein